MSTTDAALIHFQEVDNQVRRYSHHEFLTTCDIPLPASRFHFEVALTILQAAHLETSQVRNILEAVLLLHRGLSMHEHVDNQPELYRQLHVLAGDYCSGQYYWVISRVGDDALIEALCDSVVRINESKMRLFAKHGACEDKEYMSLQETIHGDLLFTLASHLLRVPDSWRPQIRSAVRAYIVRSDLERPLNKRRLSVEQARSVLVEARSETITNTTQTVLVAVSSLVADSWNVVQDLLRTESLAEGNR